MAEHRGRVAAAPWYAAKLVGTLAEDCGPCTQLVVTQAERDGVPADVLRAIVARAGDREMGQARRDRRR